MPRHYMFSLFYAIFMVEQQYVTTFGSDQQLLLMAVTQRYHHIGWAISLRKIYSFFFGKTFTPAYNLARLIAANQ